MTTDIDIGREEAHGRGRFFFEREGVRLAEMTYARRGPTHVTIDHTRVDDSLKGLGVGRRLFDTALAWARSTGTRVAATCSYARAQFEKDASSQDVYER